MITRRVSVTGSKVAINPTAKVCKVNGTPGNGMDSCEQIIKSASITAPRVIRLVFNFQPHNFF